MISALMSFFSQSVSGQQAETGPVATDALRFAAADCGLCPAALDQQPASGLCPFSAAWGWGWGWWRQALRPGPPLRSVSMSRGPSAGSSPPARPVASLSAHYSVPASISWGTASPTSAQACWLSRYSFISGESTAANIARKQHQEIMMIPRQHTLNTPYLVGPVHCYSAELAGELVLFDCGPPNVEAMAQLQRDIPLERLKHIVISHCHVDHYGLAAQLQQQTGAKLLPTLPRSPQAQQNAGAYRRSAGTASRGRISGPIHDRVQRTYQRPGPDLPDPAE